VAGLTSFSFVPWLLFALVSGALVDRVDRRRAMSGANAVRAAALAALAVLVVTRTGSVVGLYAVAFLLGAAETVYDSAVRALLPQVVSRPDLDRANSLLTVEESLGQTFLGAPVGAALFAAAAAAPLAVNAVGFAVAAVLVLSVRGVPRPQRTAAPASVRRDVVDGVGWLTRHPLLRGLTLVSAATSLVQSASTGVLVLYALEVLHVPSAGFGLLLLGAGVGALFGGALTPVVARRTGRPAALVGGAALSALACVGMGLTGRAWLGAALFALASAGVMVWNVLTMSLRQSLVPEELFGRVQGAYRTLVWGGIPLGAALGGVLARAFGVPAVFVVSGAGLGVLAVVLAVVLHRHADQLVDADEVAGHRGLQCRSVMARPRLESARLVLIPQTLEAARALLAGADPGLTLGEGYPHADTPDALRMFVEHGGDDDGGWFVVLAREALVVGDLGTFGPPDDRGRVEIGYGLAAPYRGRGLGREAVGTLVDWLVTEPGVRAVTATVEVGNEPSRRLLSGLGFALVGEEDGHWRLERRVTAPA
jgi:RimJ/RimL family protein N-acetyltransferase/predicted MFS family arabinose efflux permease